MLIVLDCGTTNTKIYLTADGQILCDTHIRFGIKDISNGRSKSDLKLAIRNAISEMCVQQGQRLDAVDGLIAYGMVTSEMGFVELPHLQLPAGIQDLADHIHMTRDEELLTNGAPVIYIRGLRNDVPPDGNLLDVVSAYDFMRGEETQLVGIIQKYNKTPPYGVFILSSHTKFIVVNAENKIEKSFTTMSGQFFQTMQENTFIGKSIARAHEVRQYPDEEIIACASRCVAKGGFLRSIMVPRFMEVLGITASGDRCLFFEAMILFEDLKILDLAQRQGINTDLDYLIVGQKERAELMRKMLAEKLGGQRVIRCITEQREISEINVLGATTIVNAARKTV